MSGKLCLILEGVPSGVYLEVVV
jgi:hypothetical protein